MTAAGDDAGPKKHNDVFGDAAGAEHRIWFEQLSEGIVIAQADPMRLVYVNKTMVEISGYEKEEMVSLTPEKIATLIHPDDRAEFFERFRRRLGGEEIPAHNEFRGIRKDGSTVWLAAHASRIEYEGKPAVLATFTDISANKKAEQALRESEAKLKAQYKAIPVPTYTWQRRGDDFILIDYNDTAVEFTRGKVADFVGITLREMYEKQPEIIREMEQCYSEKGSIEREMEYRFRSTGEKKMLAVKYAYAPPDLVIVHSDDITERTRVQMELRDHREHLEERIAERTGELKTVNERLNREIEERRKTEDQLRTSKTRYRAIVEDQTELICRFTPKYVLTFVNGNYCRFFNVRPEELIGRSFMPMISKTHRKMVERNIRSLSIETPVQTHEQQTLLPSGEISWQQWTNRAIFDEAGRIVEYQAVGRDITKEKEAEEELERSNRELVVLNEINNSINSSDSSTSILPRMLEKISMFCEGSYAGLFEVDSRKKSIQLIASFGLPKMLLKKIKSFSIEEASVQAILERGEVVILEEDIPHSLAKIYPVVKQMLGLKRTAGFCSRIGERINFLVFIGIKKDENVSIHTRHFLDRVSNQIGIALERLSLLAALETSREQLKKLTASLIDTIEEDRRRMALRLHDDMGQSLVALNVEFDLLERQFLSGKAVDRSRLDEIRDQLGEITESTRRISYALHPPVLEEFGLVTAIQRYVERFVSRKGLAVEIEASGFDTRLPRQIGITLYRVAQEALTNIVKHADASHVVVRLTKGYPRVIMKIEDDGRGFSLEKEPSKDGLGLVGMRERLERLGGDFRIDTNPGEGTRIRVTLPLEV